MIGFVLNDFWIKFRFVNWIKFKYFLNGWPVWYLFFLRNNLWMIGFSFMIRLMAMFLNVIVCLFCSVFALCFF